MTAGPLVAAVDDLYRGVVEDPAAWTDERLAEWPATLAQDGHLVTRDVARALRRCLRMATRLRDARLRGGPGLAGDDWRSTVDALLGPRAWRPTLEVALAELETDPDEERFDDVRRRFRVVHGTVWMEGTTFREWLAGRAGRVES